MDEYRSGENRPVNPRRRPRSKMQIFKESYLPVVIAAAALLLIIIFIIGSIARAVEKKNAERDASIAASSSAAALQKQLEEEAAQLLLDAEPLAAQFDYLDAIALIDSFSGTVDDFPDLAAKRSEYELAQSKMVAWDDPNKITNLSFQLLIADGERSFNHPASASLYNRSFVTTTEFSNILLQLYENGYILVDMDDFIETKANSDGSTTQSAKILYLPQGKKPLMLTQTNVNYNLYLVDSDGDKFPDKDGGGFATRMLLDNNGEIICEMINSDGNTVTGDFDLVPILEKFIDAHPDFSFKGARATLALTGYNGLFGHRTNPEAKDHYGVVLYDEAVATAKAVAQKLRNDGYTLACYTYANIGYGEHTLSEIEADLKLWKDEVEPILGQMDTLVFAQNSDIATGTGTYSGDKFSLLQKNGFTRFIGFNSEGKGWVTVNGDYVRMGRLLVSGSSMAHNSSWFSGLFDSVNILDKNRGNVPA